MRVVRGLREARFLPSRHHSALFRLFAFLRLRNAKSEPCDCVMVIDRHQSAVENHTVAIWATLTTAGYLATELSKVMPSVAAFLIAPLLAAFVIEVPLVTIGMVIVPMWNALTGSNVSNNIRMNSGIYMVLMIGAAIHYANARTWVRFVAWQFLAVVALNAIAAVVLFLLRGQIERLEAKFGGTAFEH